MNFVKRIAFIPQLLLCLTTINSQDKLPETWITYPTASVSDYGVYHFRRSFDLEKIPDHLVVHISADNRYNFLVNGERVCYGPAKGDLKTYKYDVIDIAPYLQEGKNQLAVQVSNGGKDKALALFSIQTAFLFRTENPAFAFLNSGPDWKTYKNPAYQPVSYYDMLFKERWFYGFYACGPGDNVDAASYPWGWEQTQFDDSKWVAAEVLNFDGNPPWNLVPRNIAFMDKHLVYPVKIRMAEGSAGKVNPKTGEAGMTIQPNSTSRILFDYEIFTMGYPELEVKGGRGSIIKIKYAEALYEEVNLKAHRDSVEGKIMYGVWDLFCPDGQQRIFRPLWKRTFRYVMLEIETKEEVLEILSFKNEYSGYPYPDMSTFYCDNQELNEIFEMGLRTLRMCSGETYYDTPYYEQLSYGGDNRPIAALSTYNSTDDRLLREVMRLYPQSENKETGLFKSAYPSRFDFDMGSWSLAWVQSLHDYYLIRGDVEYVSQFADKIEGVLGFFHRHMDENLGILGTVKNRNFIDWSITTSSIPRADENKEMVHSTLLTLHYLHTLDCAIKIFKYIGEEERIEKWQREAEWIRSSVLECSYDKSRGLFTDYPDQKIYSQHANLLAILCEVVSPEEQKKLMRTILNEKVFDEYVSSYFSFFLFKAMQHTGMEDEFFSHLEFWKQFLQRGFTTCGETGFASHDRSDCHAWAAHPSYYLMSIVCGINAVGQGFKEVKIKPHLGELKVVNASMPHPLGRIEIAYKMKGSRLTGSVKLPAGISGTFEYGGKTIDLKEGLNKL